MRVVMTKCKLLDGKEHTLLKAIGNGRVIRLFNKTPYPEKPTDVICPHFHELVCFYGCPYDCEWCYLKGTFRFIQRNNGRIPVRFKKERDIVNSIKTFLQVSATGQIPPTILNTGELADSLCAETPLFYGKPFSEYIMPYFEGTKHKILFLSKGTNVSNFLKHEWQKNTILSWTINAYPVARRWETLAPHPKERIQAARLAVDKGYEVRIRIDPMVAVEGFKKHYQKLVIDLLDALIPSRITLGCLRGLTSTIARAKDKSWVDYLSECSSWGRKPLIETRFQLYGNVIDCLREQGYSGNIGICKDTLEIWRIIKKRFRLDYGKIRCNCNW